MQQKKPHSLTEKYNGFSSRYVTQAFTKFAKAVIDRYGGQVKYWLSFNEQNGFFFEPGFDNTGFINGERDLLTLYTIANNTMVAHAEIANYLHAHYPND